MLKLTILKPVRLSLNGTTIKDLKKGDVVEVREKLAQSLMSDGRAELFHTQPERETKPASRRETKPAAAPECKNIPLGTLKGVGPETGAAMAQVLGKDCVRAFHTSVLDPVTREKLVAIPQVSEGRLDKWHAESLELLDG